MEFVLLCITAVILAKYAEKRSSVIFTVAHAFLFVFLLFSMFFTTDFVPVQYTLSKFMGSETYQAIRAVISAPCMWVWSANLAICVIKVFLLIFVLLWATFYVAKKLIKKGKPFERKPSAKPLILISPVSFFASDSFLFLKYCKLLN